MLPLESTGRTHKSSRLCISFCTWACYFKHWRALEALHPTHLGWRKCLPATSAGRQPPGGHLIAGVSGDDQGFHSAQTKTEPHLIFSVPCRHFFALVCCCFFSSFQFAWKRPPPFALSFYHPAFFAASCEAFVLESVGCALCDGRD